MKKVRCENVIRRFINTTGRSKLRAKESRGGRNGKDYERSKSCREVVSLGLLQFPSYNIYVCVCVCVRARVRIEGNVLGFLDIWDFLSLSHLTPHELQRASYV